ncbi:hypothetical protein HK101_009050 [Irineochytrium annulatum]|nr:hypothetical protein HK101_009050 [Irineochytrium annulatum]
MPSLKEEERIWLELRDVAQHGDASLNKFLNFFKQRAAMEQEHAQAILKLTMDSYSSSVASSVSIASSDPSHIIPTSAVPDLAANIANPQSLSPNTTASALISNPNGPAAAGPNPAYFHPQQQQQHQHQQQLEALWQPFLDTAKRVAITRTNLASFIKSKIIFPLDDFSDRRRKELDRLGGEVVQSEGMASNYLSKSRDELNKLKMNYKEKGNRWLALKDGSLPKSLKAQKDLSQADAEYRYAVSKREEERLRLEEKRSHSIQFLANIEHERLKRTAETIKSYLEVEKQWAEQSVTMVQDYRYAIEKVDIAREKHNYVRHFEERWPSYTPVLYSQLTEGDSRDFVFGVPLDVHLKSTRRQVPLVLQKCITAVEARGLHREGLYRISAKQSDILDLKVRLEKDLSKVVLEDEKYDVHVVCGVIKMFLRELPEPLLDIPEKERKEYATKTPEQKIAMVQFWMKPEFKATLKYLIYHLATVAEKCEENKMTPSNLAVVFGPPILNGNRDGFSSLEANSRGGRPNNFIEMMRAVNPNGGGGLGSAAGSPSPSSHELEGLELIKNDVIIEEMIRDRALIFTPDKKQKAAAAVNPLPPSTIPLYAMNPNNTTSSPNMSAAAAPSASAPTSSAAKQPKATEFPSRIDSLPTGRPNDVLSPHPAGPNNHLSANPISPVRSYSEDAGPHVMTHARSSSYSAGMAGGYFAAPSEMVAPPGAQMPNGGVGAAGGPMPGSPGPMGAMGGQVGVVTTGMMPSPVPSPVPMAAPVIVPGPTSGSVTAAPVGLGVSGPGTGPAPPGPGQGI